jgi:D-alanine--poly(phosphoribitol) ligase subunit 1
LSLYHFRPIHEFDESVQRDPAARAIAWSATDSVTYGDLDALANRVARFLLARGVQKGDTVALLLDKSTAAYAIIIACMRIGAPYFAVDPANPPDRTRYILGKCRPATVFAQPASSWLAAEWPVVMLDDESLSIFSAHGPERPAFSWSVTGADPAYIMFTSGSTGFPKGVAISHANVELFIHWARWQFDTQPSDVFTNLNPLYFDNSVFDIYASLFSGATLVPFTAAELREPQRVMQKIDALGCTNFFSVPSLLVYFQTLKLIDRSSFPSLRKIVFGGEGYPKARLQELYAAIGDRVTLYNVYGPTECTCICSVYVITDADFTDLAGLPPLGALIPNFDYLILDEDQARVPAGETGELYLGGPCVGIGYYGDRELTERSFVRNPTNERWPERMYRTGDLVSLNAADGKLHFAGRADTQIKHLGYRIELGEIESALARIDGIDEAVALQSTTRGLSAIVAVVATSATLRASALRQQLEALIPRYMIPSRFEFLEQLPKNANGKIDRLELKRRYTV